MDFPFQFQCNCVCLLFYGSWPWEMAGQRRRQRLGRVEHGFGELGAAGESLMAEPGSSKGKVH